MPRDKFLFILSESYIEMNEQKYDVVVDVLQKHYDKLWEMTNGPHDWGIMDQIRMEQMHQIKLAIKLWNENKSENDNCGI